MSLFGKFEKSWLRSVLFLGNNSLSLIGGAVTSASAFILIGFWVVDVLGHGGSTNPYLGIVLDLFLPTLFLLGLVLIPIGIWQRRRHLKAIGQLPSVYPQIDLRDPVFRRGIDVVIAFTFINFVIVGTASYRGVAYMDTPSFCGQACHVMKPEYTAYQVSPHSDVECASCHIGSGLSSFVTAKVNGSKQLFEVVFNRYPRPIPSPVQNLRPARDICESCHAPARFIGDKVLVKTMFADDEQNTKTLTILMLHLGGRDSLSHLTGIHGVHLGHIEYIATDPTRTTIPWVQKRNADGSETTFTTSALNGAMPKGERRLMDCIDCHNRAAHTFMTAEEVLNRAMAEGAVSPDLPWVHKKGLELLKANYATEDRARTEIPKQLTAFYRSNYPVVASQHADLVKAAGDGLVSIYTHNVFPEMRVTWGTHPNHIGHSSYPGCFRCHDGDHTSKDGKAITQDCSTCHNLLAVDDPRPKILTDIGIQQDR
jgi:nitrate/TMAO reductase-like tetraheme cytochrome c subunit